MGRPGRGQGRRVREVTRERVLAAAEDLFFSRGFAATAVDAVAHEAGYTTGAVYSNFGSKADLFVAVLERATEAQLAAARQALDAADTDKQRLAVFSAAMATEPRWQARIAATIEFLSYARGDAASLERLRVAQRQADEATAELLSALCRALGLQPAVPVADIARDVIALMGGLAVRSLFDDAVNVEGSLGPAISSLLTGDRAAIVALTP